MKENLQFKVLNLFGKRGSLKILAKLLCYTTLRPIKEKCRDMMSLLSYIFPIHYAKYFIMLTNK